VFCFHLRDSLISGGQTLQGHFYAENNYFLKIKLFQNILRVPLPFLKTTTNFTNSISFFYIFTNAASIGDDHHKYGKSGTKHELIDQLQS
jgi:hypothetical protein